MKRNGKSRARLRNVRKREQDEAVKKQKKRKER